MIIQRILSTYLSHKACVLAVPKVKGNYSLLERLRFEDSPTSAVREPTNDVAELWVGQNAMKLDWEWRFLASSSRCYHSATPYDANVLATI